MISRTDSLSEEDEARNKKKEEEEEQGENRFEEQASFGCYLMHIRCRMSANYFLRFSHTQREEIARSKDELFLSVHRHQVHTSIEEKIRSSSFFLYWKRNIHLSSSLFYVDTNR